MHARQRAAERCGDRRRQSADRDRLLADEVVGAPACVRLLGAPQQAVHDVADEHGMEQVVAAADDAIDAGVDRVEPREQVKVSGAVDERRPRDRHRQTVAVEGLEREPLPSAFVRS